MPEQKPRTNARRKDTKPDLDNIGLEIGKVPPQALDVEEAVLGAMLLEPACVDEAMEEISQSCFYDEKHRLIYDAISAIVNVDRSPVDLITVSAKLREKGNLETVGGSITLANLTEKVGSAAHIEYYLKILKQKAIQRELITASHEILHDSYDDSVNVQDLIDKAQTKIYNAIQSNVKKDVQDIGSVIKEAMADIEMAQGSTGLNGVPSGFRTLDRITQGWQKSDLIILAARPSVGKTAFSLNLARNAAVDHNMPVAFFSLEMASVQLAKRLMTSESGISADKIKGGVKMEAYEWQQMEYKLKALASAPLYIDDTPGIQLMEFRTKAKNLVKNKGVRLIIVDYLQLIQGPPELRSSREQEVAAISRTLKATAKELDVPIIALSQLSRQAVQRQGGGGKPVLSDLRESGSIEQDADMVIFIHRPDFVGLSENPEDKEKTQIIIAKHRNGETRDIDMVFKSEQVRFMEVDEALDIQASRPVESAMNAPMDSAMDDPYGGMPPFIGGSMPVSNDF